MDVKAFGFSDAGRSRTKNEDSYLCNVEEGLFLVADGMGGQASGETASQLAIRYVEEFIVRTRSPNGGWPKRERKDLTLEQHRLLAAITFANRRIYERAKERPELTGMGTTLVGALVDGARFVVANVGDSRFYRVRDGGIEQVTQDHSWVNERFRRGELSREEAMKHSQKHVLTRAVGVHEKIKIDFTLLDIRPKDLFLLCTDGLHQMLDNNKILTLIQGIADRSLYKVGISLVLQANLAGGADNITVVLVSTE